VQYHLAAGDPQPVSQLDVLDAGAGIASLVEATELEERFETDRAASAPKGHRAFRGLLVDEKGGKVLVQGKEILFARTIVVRPEHRVHIRLLAKRLLDPLQRVFPHDDVGVEEEQDIPSSHLRGSVARVCWTPGSTWELNDARRKRCGDLGGLVRRS